MATTEIRVRKVKIGSTFKVGHQFTEEEWAEVVFPFDTIECDVGQGSIRHDTTVIVDIDNRTIIITAPTDNWKVGAAEYDIRLTRGDEVISIPGDRTVPLLVVKSITTGATS